MKLTITHRYEDDPRFSVLLGKLSTMALDISKLTSDVAALTAAVTAVGTDLANLRSQIATLTATIAAGGTVTQAQVDALDASVVGAVTNLTAQVSQDAPAPAPTITTDAPTS